VAAIELRRACKTFADGTEALRGIDLEVEDGELMVLVGPSGCGKTTALRAIAGLERLTSGSVSIGGEDVGETPPADRDVAMVFQSYALYPHMTVARNIAFGLRARGVAREEQRARVARIAKALDVEALLERKPKELSGGQRQRVAMGRAIVRDPRAFLMDEPLSNLDAQLRVQLRGEIVRIQRELETTTVYVTHDQVEAMTMGQRVAVMDRGALRQVAAPQRLYEEPADVFVARFMGSPPMSLLLGRLTVRDGRPACEIGATTLVLDATTAARPDLRDHEGRELIVGVRPEAFSVVPDGSPGALAGRIHLVEMLGSESLVHVEVAARAPGEGDGGGLLAAGDAVGEAPRSARIAGRFPGRVGHATGDAVGVSVDPARLELFDRATGRALRRAGR
jgi:multiple sugar transport system ATP-binding protein